MAQPFLPPPPSSSRRRNRLVSSENASLVQKSQLPQVQHSPAAQKTNDVSQPTQLVDFNSLPLASASCDDEYAWMNQDSQPHEQNSVFDFSSQAAQSQHPTHSTADAQLVTESRMDASAHPQQSSSVFEVNSGTLQSQSLFPNPSLQASNSPFVQPLQRPLFQQQPVLQQPIQQQPVLQQPVQQQPVLQQPIQQQPVLQQPVQQQPVLQQPVQQSLFQQQPVQQQSVQQPPFQQQSVQQLSVQQQSVQVHAVQQSVQQQGSPLLSFDQQQVLSQPAAGDWTAFAQPPAETSVVSESEIDDDIDFQISQMEQELAQLDAFASEYEAMDWGTQEQKVDVKATGIYDVPAFQTPGANVGQYQRQEQSTSQSPPVLFDFDSAFQFGQSVTVSQAPFPPQSTVSGQDPLRQEALYQEPSQIRVKKSMKLSGQPTAAGSKANQRTHKAIHTFVGRHDDEVELAKGDPVNVEVTGEDGWCTGINLRTNRRGIFPSSCVVTVSNPSQATGSSSLPRFPVKFLGTVTLKTHRGMKYLSAAITKVVAARQVGKAPPPVVQVLEVSVQGLKVYFTDNGSIDKSKRANHFPLEKVTYIGQHPQHNKFFGFITESPSRQGGFVCSVFVYQSDSKPICEAVSRAFRNLKGAYLDHSNPTYDFYAE